MLKFSIFKTAFYVGYIFGLIYHFFILITYVKVEGSNLNNSLATTLSFVVHCVPHCNLQHPLQVGVLGMWSTSLANMQQKTQKYVLLWKRYPWRWHNNPCKSISLWLKSHEKRSKSGRRCAKSNVACQETRDFYEDSLC